jgi:MurNAc alpha-1-phosphate uridylyltransferase
MLPVAILCGGKGTRLGELTRDRPKSLVEVCGRPFIEWQLELLLQVECPRVVLCVGHLGDQIVEATNGYLCVISRDGYEPRGTGGAVKKALPLLGPNFMVLYGDSYLECCYPSVEYRHLHGREEGLVTLYNGVDYGLSCFSRKAVEEFPRDVFDLGELKEQLALRDQLAVYQMEQRWYEIGTPEGLEETCRHLQQRT